MKLLRCASHILSALSRSMWLEAQIQNGPIIESFPVQDSVLETFSLPLQNLGHSFIIQFYK